jgi:hypothetical protein
MLSEPRTYGLSKNKLIYSVIGLVFMVGAIILESKNFPLFCFVPLGLFVLYLFVPFLYKLVVSNEAISSVNYFRTQTLAWNEIAGIKPKSGGTLLINNDGDIKVYVNSQIDGYPEIIKLLQEKCPNLWILQETTTFHQSILESIYLVAIGFGFMFFMGSSVISKGFSIQKDYLFLAVLGICLLVAWKGLSRVREVSLDNDILVIKHLGWQNRFHVSEVQSVGLEQQMNKNEILYPVHIRLKSGKQVILEKIKEGNPILLNVLEQWLEKYKMLSL